MEKAKQLLADPRYKISDISSRVGYSDGNYLEKALKKYTGFSPSNTEIRKRGENLEKNKTMVSGSESAIQVHPGASDDRQFRQFPFFFFYGKAYDMIVSYTIRQEQDRSAETAPLIEESIQKIVDVSDSISSLDFYQTLLKMP